MTTFWAISSIGYGKAETLEDAVANHDKIVGRDWGHMLNVPVAEIPLQVWEREAEGFVLDSQVRWNDGTPEKDGPWTTADVSELRAVRSQTPGWHDHVKAYGAKYINL